MSGHLPYAFALVSALILSTVRAAENTPLASCPPADQAMNQLAPGEIVQRLYQTVSGEAQQPRNWNMLRSFHASNGIISTSRHLGDGTFAVDILSVEQFIALNKDLFSARGFFESELNQHTQIVGHVAHVWSHYTTRETPNGAPYAQGVNSFQLINDGKRWCVLSATWDGDSQRHQADLDKLFNN